MAAETEIQLELDPPKRNIFVTQLGDGGEDGDGEDINKYPVVKESADKLIDTGLNTMQSTLLLKKEVVIERVHSELLEKKREHEEKMKAFNVKRKDLMRKQQAFKDRVDKFDKFIKENDAKRARAIQKYQTEQRLNDHFKREHRVLTAELDELKDRHHKLIDRLQLSKIFELYMGRVLEILPDNYLELSDTMSNSLMMRHRTLYGEHSTLVERMSQLSDQLKAAQTELDDKVYRHNQNKLVINKDLAELQLMAEHKAARSKELEELMAQDKESFRDKITEFGMTLLAIRNLAERCQKRHEPPVEDLSYAEMLKRIELFVIERDDVEKMAGSKGGKVWDYQTTTQSKKDFHSSDTTTRYSSNDKRSVKSAGTSYRL